ncbi:lipopolysaccharide assembly LapA domain-containing protein [Gordonia sp. NPDC058843]|uniref:LapA family protein n=1 Tax=Gordonia sp. NPDC058843 TaxID=3346648 RepID=UPI003695B0F1
MTTPEDRRHTGSVPAWGEQPAGSPVPAAGHPQTPDQHSPDPGPDHRARRQRTVADVEHTRTRATWFGVVIGAIILVLLLVFIVQNLDSQTIELLFWEVNLPLGVSLLIAAIAGALIVALVGGLRMLQLRRALKKTAT